MILEIKVNDEYKSEILSILENLKGVMIDSISKRDTRDDLGFLTTEIEEGLNSGMSESSHIELFDRLKEKYA